MQISERAKSRTVVVVITLAAVFLVWTLFGFEPVTRTLVATDGVCVTCHQETDYSATVATIDKTVKPVTKPHPSTPEGGQSTCIECHSPRGTIPSIYVYTHVLQFTDFFGRTRDHEKERAGAWVAPAAKRAYRVRNAMMESDSTPCRVCHIESKIKLKTKRGKNAHATALKKKETCLACHDNLVHAEVPLPPE